MAENKKSFILYVDLIHTIEHLEEDEAGRLFKHLMAYVNDLNPEAPDKLTKVLFEPIKRQLKRDLAKYEHKKENWSEAGRASAEARRLAKEAEKTKQNSTDSTNVDKHSECSTDSTVNVTDTVTVNVNVNENTNTASDFERFWLNYPKKSKRLDAWQEWQAMNPSSEMANKIQAALIRFKNSEQWNLSDGRYIPKAANWLMDRGWESETPSSKINGHRDSDCLIG